MYPTPRRLYHLTWNLTKQTSSQSPNNDSPTALRGLDAAGDSGILRKEGWEQARRRHRLEHVGDEQQSCATQAYFAPEKVVTCASSQLLRCFYIFPGKGLKISRTSASVHRKKNPGRHIFLSFVFLRNSRYTVVVLSETNTFTWRIKKATAKSSEDSEMHVKAALVGSCV